MLKEHGINPTSQRVLVAGTLLRGGTHIAVDDLFRIVNQHSARVSKATVYNTLSLLAKKGVIRAVIAGPGRVFYDPNMSPHHHFYDEATGKFMDIDGKQVRVTGLPALPEGTELQSVEVIVRVRGIHSK